MGTLRRMAHGASLLAPTPLPAGTRLCFWAAMRGKSAAGKERAELLFLNFFLARGVMRGGREAFLEAKKQKEPPPRWGLQQDEGITGRETRRGGENWMKNSY